MERIDWLELWRELASRFRYPEPGEKGGPEERWRGRARGFDAAVKRRWKEHDPLREFVLKNLHPWDRAIDIGTGTGSWSIPMAKVAKQVTAIDPSPSMLAILRENIAEEGLTNIEVREVRWQDADVEPHDVALCSHAMYTSPDLAAFVKRMEKKARQTCYLLMRVPPHDGIIGELSHLIHGRWHDSPNFVVGYNALLSLGIYPHVIMEEKMRCWTSDSLEEAFVRAKRHLRLEGSTAHDELIRRVLAQRLTFQDGKFRWPDGMRSALAWWRPEH